MLNGIHLVDFGNHRDTRLTFGRMTALVGQNGAGKTGVLRGVMEVSRAYQTKLYHYVADQPPARAGASDWSASASWDGECGGREGTWGLIVNLGKPKAWRWRASAEDDNVWVPKPRAEEATSVGQEDAYSALIKQHGMSLPVMPGVVIKPELITVGPWAASYFKTSGRHLQGPSYSESIPPTLGEDCHDLAWMVAYLKGDKDEVFNNIVSALREVVPVFRRVRHRPVGVQRLEKKSITINKQERSFDEEQRVMGQEMRFDMASGEDLPASAISEGTLITLAILTAVMQSGDSGGSQTILLDDIESGLHPRAQRDLIRQIRKLQETRPELQIIFSTHSPYILDEMEPEDVWILAPDAEGIAHAARLSEHPDLERARGLLTTGELWSAEGEAWVLDPAKRARPAQEPAEPAGAVAAVN